MRKQNAARIQTRAFAGVWIDAGKDPKQVTRPHGDGLARINQLSGFAGMRAGTEPTFNAGTGLVRMRAADRGFIGLAEPPA